jgi:anti-sigma factor RsiW
MLPERLSELLSSYLDGELNARQRRNVERLLLRSEEARKLLEKLEENANVLRNLPRLRLDEEFSQRVMRTLSQRRSYLARKMALSHRVEFPAWAGFAAAASVLLSIVLGTYLYFSAVHLANHNSSKPSPTPRDAPPDKETIPRDSSQEHDHPSRGDENLAGAARWQTPSAP